jgi:hypothetical protein
MSTVSHALWALIGLSEYDLSIPSAIRQCRHFSFADAV